MDPQSPSKQIADQLRSAIVSGHLKPGDKLPSQNELAKLFGVARETVKSALRILATEALISSRQGSGSYVNTPSNQKGERKSHLPDRSVTAFMSALETLKHANRQAASAASAMPDPKQAFDHASQLADSLREMAEAAADLRAKTAVRIAEQEKLTLAGLARKISVSSARAGQLVQRARKSNETQSHQKKGSH
ncbi:GntR family transcriptional regulator [Spirillospora sp. NBC_00431]